MDEKISSESLYRFQIIDVRNRIQVFYDRRQWAEVLAAQGNRQPGLVAEG